MCFNLESDESIDPRSVHRTGKFIMSLSSKLQLSDINISRFIVTTIVEKLLQFLPQLSSAFYSIDSFCVSYQIALLYPWLCTCDDNHS